MITKLRFEGDEDCHIDQLDKRRVETACQALSGNHCAHALEQLCYLQAELIRILTERSVEVDLLHKRVRGQEKVM